MDESLAQWFDDAVWNHSGSGEFNSPLEPEVLLNDAPDVLWPGLMLPDCLPVIGNRYGDWLCIRVGPNNRVDEIVHWYHGGGDWIPWGRSLEEALAFETLRQFLPGRRQFHAISAEPLRNANLDDSLTRWAFSFLPSSVLDCLRTGSPQELATALIDSHVAEAAVHCELALAALDSPLRSILTPDVANQIGVSWEPDAIRWLFDQSLIDSSHANDERVQSILRQGSYQDWLLAKEHCASVANQRSDLGWVYDVLGWAAEKEEDLQSAVDYYANGAMASSFADQSIRFRTHWYPHSAGKFSIWRLLELSRAYKVKPIVTLEQRNYLELFAQSPPRPLASVVSAYWNQIGTQARGQGDWSKAYEAFYRGGWDMGIDRISNYRQQLRSLIEASRNAGQTARASVAQAHLNTFCDRYGEQ